MPKIFNVILLIIISIVWFSGVQAITTGDLIILPKDTDDWPPLILERPELPYVFGTTNFLIHYTLEGEDSVYQPDVDDDPADGTPDYINRMAEYLELSHSTYIDVLMYDNPPRDNGHGGDQRYDIYVTNCTGLTVPEFRSDEYPGRQAYAAYSFIGNDMRNEHHPDDPLPFMKATCAHEYFHAVQMAYRGYTEDEVPWWHELTACWAEERAFDDLNEVYYYIRDYYLKIDKSIYLTGGSHMYGAWVYAEYLSQNYGNDIIRLVFEKLISFDYSLAALTTSLNETGLNFDTEFSRFACWNYFTNENHDPDFFEEGRDFPVTVPLAAVHYDYPTPWYNTPQSVENLGIAYIYFDNPGVVKSNLVIEFISDIVYPEGLGLAAIYHDRPVEISTSNIDPDQTITLVVEDFQDCAEVVLCVNWRYQDLSLLDSACYRYYAYLDTVPVGLTSDMNSQPSEFRLLQNYPNPFNLSSNIIFNWHLEPLEYNIFVFDLGGRLIDKMEGLAEPGANRVLWIPANEIASGVYLYRLQIGDKTANRRMILLK